jgi:hypothetical protein
VGKVFCWKGVMRIGADPPGVQNKANLARSFKFEVSSVKLEKARLLPSDFKLDTSHFKLPTCAKQSQFRRAGLSAGARGRILWPT